MADAVVVQEFLATLGYRVDEASQRRFVDSLESIGKTVAGLGLGLTGLAGTIAGVVSSMAGSASQMNFVAQNLGESVTSIERLIYSWQRLGVAPDAVIKGLQTIQQMKLTDPGTYAIFSSEEFGGKGTPTEQLEHFLQKFRTESEAERRITLERFKGFDFSMLMTAASRGDQSATGGREFDLINQRFHFDPEKFAKESTAFEQAWMSFHQRLNTWYKANIAGPLQVLETQGLIALSDWVDQHAPEITKKLEDMGRDIRAAFMVGVDVIKDLIGRFEKMPAGAKQAAEAIAIIGGALVVLQANPAILALAALGYVLEKLIKDYEAWKEAGSKGPSPLGIDYTAVGKTFETILTKANDVAQALGGWEKVLLDLALLVGGAKFLGVFVRAFGAIGTAAVTAGTTIAGTATGIMAALGPVLLAIGTVETFMKATNPETYAPDNLSKNSPFWRGLPASEFRKRFPDEPLPPGMIGDHPRPSAPEAAAAHVAAATPATPAPTGPGEQQEAPSWFRRFMNLMIPEAHGEELPQNLKQVDTSLQDLKETMDRWEQTILESMLRQDFAAGGGGGGGSSSGGGGGGRGGTPINWNDPKVVHAVQFLMQRGYSWVQAMGIVDNLYAESGLDPQIVNPTGHAGLPQLDFSRQAAYQKEKGKPFRQATTDEQLAYVDEEIQKMGLRSLFNQVKSLKDAVTFIHGKYEKAELWDLQRRLDMIKNAQIPQVPPSANALANIHNNNNQRDITLHVQNTNNVAATDPGLAANELDRMHQRQWSDLQRRLQPTFH